MAFMLRETRSCMSESSRGGEVGREDVEDVRVDSVGRGLVASSRLERRSVMRVVTGCITWAGAVLREGFLKNSRQMFPMVMLFSILCDVSFVKECLLESYARTARLI